MKAYRENAHLREISENGIKNCDLLWFLLFPHEIFRPDLVPL